MTAPISSIDDISTQLMHMRHRAEILTALVEECDKQLGSLIDAGLVTRLAMSMTGFDHVIFQAYEVKIGLCTLEEAVEEYQG